MWAQAMVEHGLLSGAAAGVSAARYHIEAALADGPTRWAVIGGGLLLLVWLVRRR
jgi:hypothetical protein